MVVRGTFIAFLGDWLHATKLCIRIPSKGILLISESIANPLVPQFDNPEEYTLTLRQQEQLTIDGVIRKLDNHDHHWATPKGTHLLDVMAGASLITLRLACKGKHLNYPDDVFQEILPEEIRDEVDEITESWEGLQEKHAKKKAEAIQKMKDKRKAAKLSTIQEGRDSSGDPDPFMDKGMCLAFSSISFPMIPLIDPGNRGSEGGGNNSARGSRGGQGSFSLRTLGSEKAQVNFRIYFHFLAKLFRSPLVLRLLR